MQVSTTNLIGLSMDEDFEFGANLSRDHPHPPAFCRSVNCAYRVSALKGKTTERQASRHELGSNVAVFDCLGHLMGL